MTRVAYVTTGYPYVSHTFIQNEVRSLRERGMSIDTFAIVRAPDSECRTPADRAAQQTTYALRPPRIRHYLRAHLCGLVRRPHTYFGALRQALRMAGPAPGDLVRHLAYFVQGVVLWHRCRKAGIGHVHAHFANVSSDVALLAAALGAPELSWSFTLHGPTELYDVRHHRLAEKTRNARFVVCISDFARSQLMGLVAPAEWDKLHVVHCGIDVARFAPAARAGNGAVASVSCVGRLVAEKGQSLLIDAVAAIRGSGVDMRLTLVGDGPQREALESRARALGIADAVEFLGAVAHTRVDEVLRRSDIFCLPSFAEGVPIVLMEAMAMKLPVVACGVMGIPELVADGVSGRLVRPGSRADLIAVLEALAGDERQRAQLGQAARAAVASGFELGASADRLCALYGEYLEEPSVTMPAHSHTM